MVVAVGSGVLEGGMTTGGAVLVGADGKVRPVQAASDRLSNMLMDKIKSLVFINSLLFNDVQI
jgi:hypothetical protein